jgi:hypothetical protein
VSPCDLIDCSVYLHIDIAVSVFVSTDTNV